MAKEAHLYCYGYIYSDQSEYASEWGVVSLTRMLNEYKAQLTDDTESVMVHIHSCGGEVNEGYAIHDWLKTLGKTVNTIIEGDCKSIATVIALSGSKRSMTSNAEFMIHNPWGWAMGDAGAVQEYADELKAAEEKLLNFYVEKTGGDSEKIKAMMQDEKNISADDAKALGFVTEVVNTLKAVALFSTKNKSDNSKQIQNMKNLILDSIKKEMDDLKALFSGKKPEAAKQNASVSTSDGKTLYYTGDLAVDTMVFTDEAMTAAAADGDYVLSDGRTVTVAAGKVTAIKDAAASTDDVVALQEQVSKLTKDISDRDEKLKYQDTEIASIKSSFETLAAEIKSKYKPENRTQSKPNSDGKVNAFQEAIDRKKAEAEKK